VLAVGPEFIIAAAGAAIGAYGSLYQGAAGKAAGEYNAELAARNAGLARSQASADMRDKERENRRYMGALRASFGASGLAFEGSALDLFEDQSAEAELAVRRIRYSGELRALGLMQESELQRMKADTATTAGYIGAASNVAAGAGTYFRLKRGTPSSGSYAE